MSVSDIIIGTDMMHITDRNQKCIGYEFNRIIFTHKLEFRIIQIVMQLVQYLFVYCKIDLIEILYFEEILLLMIVFDLSSFLNLFLIIFLSMENRNFNLFLILRHLLFELVSLLLLLIVRLHLLIL